MRVHDGVFNTEMLFMVHAMRLQNQYGHFICISSLRIDYESCLLIFIL